MVLFHDYAFCGDCHPQVEQDYKAYLATQNTDMWRQGVGNQLIAWKQRAISAVGASTSARRGLRA